MDLLLFINWCDLFIIIDYLCYILCISIFLCLLFWYDRVLICVTVGVVALRLISFQETSMWIFIYGFFLYNLFHNFFYEFAFRIFFIWFLFLVLCHAFHDWYFWFPLKHWILIKCGVFFNIGYIFYPFYNLAVYRSFHPIFDVYLFLSV